MIDIVLQRLELVERMVCENKISTQAHMNAVLACLGKVLAILFLECGTTEDMRDLFHRYVALCNVRLDSTGSGNSDWIW